MSDRDREKRIAVDPGAEVERLTSIIAAAIAVFRSHPVIDGETAMEMRRVLGS